MMKRTYYSLMLLASLFLYSCGGSGDDPEPTPVKNMYNYLFKKACSVSIAVHDSLS